MPRPDTSAGAHPASPRWRPSPRWGPAFLLGREGELPLVPGTRGRLAAAARVEHLAGGAPKSPPRGLLPIAGDVLAEGPTALLLLSGQDGALRWKAAVREPTGAALDGDLVWTAEQSGRLLALDRRSGAQRRVVPLGQRIVSAPSVALGRVWVGLEDRSLVGIDAHGEQPPWHASLPAPLLGGVVEWQDRVLVPTAGREGRLLAIDLVRPGSPASARVDSALRTAPLVRTNVAGSSPQMDGSSASGSADAGVATGTHARSASQVGVEIGRGGLASSGDA